MNYIVCDGGLYMLAYLYHNYVRPNFYMLGTKSLYSKAPYINDNDNVLLIMHGCTHISLYEWQKLMLHLDKLKIHYTVFANFLIPQQREYILYSGDFLTGMKKRMNFKDPKEFVNMDIYKSWNASDDSIEIFDEPEYNYKITNLKNEMYYDKLVLN